MNSLRELFRKMKYVGPYDYEELRINSALIHDAPLIFNEDEIKEYSLKWLKRLLLVKTRLSTINQLEAEIKRYSMNDFEKAIQDCMLLSQEADSSGIEYIIVLKAIPRDTTGMIPNYRIYSSNDVASVFDKFLSQNRNKDNEIWFCQTITARNSGNLGGRLTLNRTHHNEYIEIVWYTSPRRIEDAQSQNFPYPYWRAIRPLGRAQFCTEHLRIPSNYRDHIEDEYISEGKQTLIEIMKYREELDILKSILFALDAKEVTIEFIMEEGNLKFIDWDTDIEYEAIKNSKGRSN